MASDPASSAPPPDLGQSLRRLADALVRRVCIAYLIVLAMALLLTDALAPLPSGTWLASMIAGLAVGATGVFFVARVVRQLAAGFARRSDPSVLFTYADYTTIGLTAVPGLGALLGVTVASVLLLFLGHNPPVDKVVVLTLLVGSAAVPAMHAALSLVVSDYLAVAVPGGLPAGRRMGMMSAGVRSGLAVLACTLVPVTWYTWFALEQARQGATGTDSLFLAAFVFGALACLSVLALWTWSGRVSEHVRLQLIRLREQPGTAEAPWMGLDEFGAISAAARDADTHIADISARVRQLADGELSTRFMEPHVLGDALRTLARRQRRLVRHIGSLSAELRAVAEDFRAHSAEIAEGALAHVTEVEASRRTMDQLRQAALEINRESRELSQAAEELFEGNETVSDRIGHLVDHQVKIEELLDTVRGISERSDILALNASLEGVRAGEAGRGFSLVAGEMRRMTEKVKDAAGDIRAIVSNVRVSARDTMSATEQSRNLGERMVSSVQRILDKAGEQQSTTGQVAHHVGDISHHLGRSADEAGRTRELADWLAGCAEELRRFITPWSLPSREFEDPIGDETRAELHAIGYDTARLVESMRAGEHSETGVNLPVLDDDDTGGRDLALISSMDLPSTAGTDDAPAPDAAAADPATDRKPAADDGAAGNGSTAGGDTDGAIDDGDMAEPGGNDESPSGGADSVDPEDDSDDKPAG